MQLESKITFGLSRRDIETISGILKKYPEVTEVHIFGSRAKGNYKPGSDIDLAVMNKGLDDKTMLRIKADFEDSTLPYTIDMVSFPSINHPELKEHIDRVGLLFYQRS